MYLVVGLCVLNSSMDLLFGDLLAKIRIVHVNAYSSTMVAPLEHRSHQVAVTVKVGVETEEEGHFKR